MLKIAIIGCGKQADEHISIIRRIRNCKIVGVCDKEELMAKQLYERFNTGGYFKEVDELLEKTKPNIVHIITSPESHYELAKKCMEYGCNIIVEKPFTINATEAEELIKFACERELKLTVGHDNQFSSIAIKMRKLINEGYLGGNPILMESIWGYDLGDEKYAKGVMADKRHWVMGLPGKLLQNIISHGIAKIVEFINDDNPGVVANGFKSSFVKRIGKEDIYDELRVIIYDSNGSSGYFTFSTQIRPIIRQFRIYGPSNSLIIDDMHHLLIKIKGNSYKSYLNHFLPPFIYSKEYIGNAFNNILEFAKRDLDFNYGRKILFESFYNSVLNNEPLPIKYKEIILTAKIMDSIFNQIYSI